MFTPGLLIETVNKGRTKGRCTTQIRNFGVVLGWHPRIRVISKRYWKPQWGELPTRRAVEGAVGPYIRIDRGKWAVVCIELTAGGISLWSLCSLWLWRRL
jgi:hypothetical protein